MRSRCKSKTCGRTFHHLGAVTLKRLCDVPALRNELPFDPEWRFGPVTLHCVHTSRIETDMINRHGMETCLETVARLGAESVQSIVERFLAAGQQWFDQLV